MTDRMTQFTKLMHQYGFTDAWYAHPGEGHYHQDDTWHIGFWTGPGNDLICVKRCDTKEEAEEYLSPGASTPFKALKKAIALREEKGLTFQYKM